MIIWDGIVSPHENAAWHCQVVFPQSNDSELGEDMHGRQIVQSSLRAIELTGALIPIGALGMTTSVAAGIARASAKLTYGAVVNKVVMELHWRANVETWLSGIGGGKITTKANGPANKVMFLFSSVGAQPGS